LTNSNLAAPMARYFVIHDTSGPNFGRRSFPDDIDEGGKVNDLRNFECHDGSLRKCVEGATA
jgi:hypothetical protein